MLCTDISERMLLGTSASWSFCGSVCTWHQGSSLEDVCVSRKWKDVHTYTCTQACTPCPSSHAHNAYAHTCRTSLILPYTRFPYTHVQSPVASFPVGAQYTESCHGLKEEFEDMQCEPPAQLPALPGAVSHACTRHSVLHPSGRHFMSLLC